MRVVVKSASNRARIVSLAKHVPLEHRVPQHRLLETHCPSELQSRWSMAMIKSGSCSLSLSLSLWKCAYFVESRRFELATNDESTLFLSLNVGWSG